MVKFLRKSDSRGDKIARINSICIRTYINFFTFLPCLGPLCDSEIFRAQFIYGEVYDYLYYLV